MNIQAVYKNCIQHAEDTEAFWQRVHDFLAPHYNKYPEVLEIYNALEEYVYGSGEGADKKAGANRAM